MLILSSETREKSFMIQWNIVAKISEITSTSIGLATWMSIEANSLIENLGFFLQLLNACFIHWLIIAGAGTVYFFLQKINRNYRENYVRY